MWRKNTKFSRACGIVPFLTVYPILSFSDSNHISLKTRFFLLVLNYAVFSYFALEKGFSQVAAERLNQETGRNLVPEKQKRCFE